MQGIHVRNPQFEIAKKRLFSNSMQYKPSCICTTCSLTAYETTYEKDLASNA
jgi:hypothetical protein